MQRDTHADLHAGRGGASVGKHVGCRLAFHSRHSFLSFSGVCVCGSDGHGVVGELAGAMPSWDWVHEVDPQMRGGVCAGISGEVAVVSAGVPC